MERVAFSLYMVKRCRKQVSYEKDNFNDVNCAHGFGSGGMCGCDFERCCK